MRLAKTKNCRVESEAEKEQAIKRNKHVLPAFMKEFQSSLEERERPDPIRLEKSEYIFQWLNFFDERSFSSKKEKDIKEWRTHTMTALEDAFEWTLRHYSELDMGGGMRWYGYARTVVKLISEKKWNRQIEKDLLYQGIAGVRWAEEVL